MRTLPLVLLALLLGLPPTSAAADGRWPFGAREDAGPFERGRDLWCLGILGAKASDPDGAGPAPSEDLGGGTRRIAGEGRRPSDEPSRLRVEVLFPGGAAEEAGLRVGDVIVGVGRSRFKEQARTALAEALVKAEAGKGKGRLTLRVEREGEREKVEVVLPVADKDAAKPVREPARERVLQAALAWLAERQDANGGFAQTLSGLNGSVVMTSLAGLAWLAGGSDLEEGPYREHVAKAATFVAENAGETFRMPAGMGGGASDRASRMQGMDQSNWGWAHTAIFLGELEARSPAPKVRAALLRCGETLVRQQEPSGGWAHGPGGPNPLGYTELNIVTGLALCGIGMAQRAGYEVPEEALAKADAYLRASSGGGGGVGYSTEPGQRGQGNIGRTAGCWLGYRLLGKARDGWCRKMGAWCERHVDDVMGGHASLMQHVLLSGVASHALGKRAAKRWWETLETDYVLARAPDGSFQPRPWHESLQMASNSDVTFGEVWTTAAWAIVVGCEPVAGGRPGLPVWLGR